MTTPTPTRALAGGLLAAVVALTTACGGGSDDDTDAANPTSNTDGRTISHAEGDTVVPDHPVRDVHDDIAIYPSAEQIEQASADVLYVTTWGDPADTTKASVQGGPLWPTLPAVQQRRVYEVSDDVWMLGIGVLGANALLDDIERTLPG
jgi:ABC-type Fe3+-hydroxamate transport system substrate-binding protein